MLRFANKKVLVLGLGDRGRAACELLWRAGAIVTGADNADSSELRSNARALRALGVEVALGVSVPPPGDFSLAVVSPAVPMHSPLARAAVQRHLLLVSELELGLQAANCSCIAIAGTNGKGTTAELIERALAANHRKAIVCGHRARPICAVADQTKDVDFLVVQVNSFQLETTRFFRPAVAVLLNLAPDHLNRYASGADYARTTARLLHNQQAFDWAVVQRHAHAQLLQLRLPMPARTITFSAFDRDADLFLDRGLLISRLPSWCGPLLDMDHCQVRGPHNAENLMAALAVGHVLRLPLGAMVEPMKSFSAGPHRFELVGEIDGVQFINDSKATNVDALEKALLAIQPRPGGEPRTWLIAGGHDEGLDFHDVGPLLSRRVKRAFLIGEAAERISSAWTLFTPCTKAGSLLEAVSEAAKQAAPGDAILFSPACSSFDQFRDYQERGESFCQAVKSISRGARVRPPNIQRKTVDALKMAQFCGGFF